MTRDEMNFVMVCVGLVFLVMLGIWAGIEILKALVFWYLGV